MGRRILCRLVCLNNVETSFLSLARLEQTQSCLVSHAEQQEHSVLGPAGMTMTSKSWSVVAFRNAGSNQRTQLLPSRHPRDPLHTSVHTPHSCATAFTCHLLPDGLFTLRVLAPLWDPRAQMTVPEVS